MWKRILVLAAIIALLSLASVGAAQASIQTLTVDRKATLIFTGDVIVTGTIQCTPGETFQVGVILNQTRKDDTAGGNSNTFSETCTGLTQQWAVAATPSEGVFQTGRATAVVVALTETEFATFTTRLHIRT